MTPTTLWRRRFQHTEPRSDGESIRILVVDDEEDQFVLTGHLLKSFRAPTYAVGWAVGPGLAQSALEGDAFDVCLVDYRLGVMDGLDFIRTAAIAHPDVAFLLVTGRGDRAVDLEALSAGAIGYLSKSGLDSTSLDRAIRYAVAQHRLLREVTRNRDQAIATEELTRVLQEDGPTTETLREAVDIVVKRFGHAAAALYLLDGTTLTLAASSGEGRPIRLIHARIGTLARVLAGSTPAFLPAWSEDRSDAPSAIRTELTIPLRANHRALGLLTVASRDDAPIGETDHRALVALAGRVAEAIGLHTQSTWLRDRLTTMRNLEVLGHALGGMSAESGFADHLLDAVRRFIDAQAVALFVSPGPAETPRAATDGWLDTALAAFPGAFAISIGEDIAVSAHGDVTLVRVPLRLSSRRIGELALVRPLAMPFTQGELEGLRLAASSIALALAASEFRADVADGGVRDAATGFLSRAFLDEWIAMAARTGPSDAGGGGSLGVLLVDLPDSLACETAGCAAPAVLERVGLIAGNRLIAHFEGSTFAVLDPAEQPATLQGVADRLQAAMGADRFAAGLAVRGRAMAGDAVIAAASALAMANRVGGVVVA